MTVLGVVVSRADEASVRIGDRLRDVEEWTEREDAARADADGGGRYWRTEGAELRTFDDLHLHLGDPVPAFEAAVDCVAFVSRHAGDTGPLLTAHHTGNFGPADHGGDPGAFAPAAPAVHRRAVRALADHAPAGYEASTECTHHGPTDVSAPSLFVELGSSEAEWRDDAAAEAVARATLDCRDVDPLTDRAVVLLGGGHYAPRAERLVRETGWAVGHVGADWALDDAAPGAVERAMAASGAEIAVVADRPDRSALVDAVESAGGRVVSERWLREADGVPIPLLDRLTERLVAVDEGLRTGDAAVGAPADASVVVRDLPPDLVDEAASVDRARASDAVASEALAVETAEGGTRPRGRVALPDGDGYDRIVDALAGVLEERYETVERRADAVVARRTAFDPDRARELGVSPGPAFGKLADGEPVDADGRTIEPEEVHAERVERFPV